MQERTKEFYSLEELLKPQQIFIVNIENQEQVAEEIDRFFGSVLNVLEYTEEELRAFVERTSSVLHDYDTEGVIHPTDDRITLLSARGKVIASVMETRTEFNYVQVSSASYLNPEMIRGIKHLGEE